MIPTIIDVAISLIVIFFLLSTLVSFINEIISLIISSRGKLLKNSLDKLLADEADADASPLVNRLYESKHIYKLRIFNNLKSRGYLPANISPDSFSNAMLELVNNKLPLTTIDEIKAHILANVPDGFLKQKLLLLIAELKPENYNLAGFKEKIQDWYNGYMHTVTEVYRLRTRVIIFIISVILCFTMNIDTLSLSEYFWKNKTAREQMVSYAEGLDTNALKTPQIIVKYDTVHAIDGGSMKIDTAVVAMTEVEKMATSKADARSIVATLNSLDMPINWSKEKINGLNFWDVLLKILGIMVTACCLTLGAPFWFQLMKNLIKTKDTIVTSDSSTKVK